MLLNKEQPMTSLDRTINYLDDVMDDLKKRKQELQEQYLNPTDEGKKIEAQLEILDIVYDTICDFTQ